jgi:hypothetical protein
MNLMLQTFFCHADTLHDKLALYSKRFGVY